MRPHLDERTGTPVRTITSFIYRQLTPAEQTLYICDPSSERYAYSPPVGDGLERPPVLFEPTAAERERAHSVNSMTPPAPVPLHRHRKGKVPIVPRHPRRV